MFPKITMCGTKLKGKKNLFSITYWMSYWVPFAQWQYSHTSKTSLPCKFNDVSWLVVYTSTSKAVFTLHNWSYNRQFIKDPKHQHINVCQNIVSLKIGFPQWILKFVGVHLAWILLLWQVEGGNFVWQCNLDEFTLQ